MGPDLVDIRILHRRGAHLARVGNLLRPVLLAPGDAPRHNRRNHSASNGTEFSGEHFWARGYAVSTVGFELEQVRQYIREQQSADDNSRQF